MDSIYEVVEVWHHTSGRIYWVIEDYELDQVVSDRHTGKWLRFNTEGAAKRYLEKILSETDK